MENEQVISIPLLEMGLSFVTDGVEKSVYRIEEDGRPLAMKIYKSIIPGENEVNRDKKAREEFRAYEVLKESSLNNFVPDPIRIVTTQLGKAIGLVVEWRKGVSLENGGEIAGDQIDELENGLLGLTEKGIEACFDMYSEGNVMTGDNGVWFAECQIRDLRGDGIMYQRNVKNIMTRIRENCAMNV